MKTSFWAVPLFAAVILCSCQKNEAKFLAGTFGQHLYEYTYNSKTKTFSQKAAFEAKSPSFMALDESGNYMYAVGEAVYSFKKTDDVWAQTGVTEDIGQGSCHICVNPDNDLLFTAEYGGGSLSIFKLDNHIVNGKYKTIEYGSDYFGYGPIPDRQSKSYMHQSRILPKSICDNVGIKGTWLLATDLGNDIIRVGEIIKDSELIFNETENIQVGPGTGPRHMEFDTVRNTLYCMTELSDQIFVWHISSNDGKPVFTYFQGINVKIIPAGGGADIHLSPDGRFLYASCRLDDEGIGVFNVMPEGTLTVAGYYNTAKHPRNFAITPDGKRMFVACKDSHCIEVYRLNKKTGALEGPEATLDFGNEEPVCVLFE